MRRGCSEISIDKSSSSAEDAQMELKGLALVMLYVLTLLPIETDLQNTC